MPSIPTLLQPSEVARILGISGQRVRDMDDELKPMRLASRDRVYDPAVVERVRVARLKKQKSKASR